MTEPFDDEEDLPIIDVRSPGERMVDSGRAGFGRVQDYLRPDRLAVAAVVWMIAVAVSVGVTIWQAVALGRQYDGIPFDRLWIKLALLADSGNLTVTLATLAGSALVAFSEPVRARVAAYLGVVIGLWSVAAAGFGVAVTIHGKDNPFLGLFGANGFAAGLGFVASAALGVVVTAIALALSRAGSVAEVS